MLKFTDYNRQMPIKREAEIRRHDFKEIYEEYERQKAKEQAARCSQCGVPFCQIHCPLHNNIPDWLMLCAQDRLEEAYHLSIQTNPFPEICGRVCPQDRLCEGNCVIEQSGHGTVTIGTVERYLTETAFANDWVKPITPLKKHQESIGIIGAGPAGLAAAITLRESGYHVDVYDRYDRVGGLLIYGIPNFKIDKSVVLRRQKWLEYSGVTFHMNVDIGKDMSFDDLKSRHNAILIATGVYKSRDLKAPGVGMNGIIEALDFLTISNRKGLGDNIDNWHQHQFNSKGKNIVVIGGGDTAMDCVRTAMRQEAASVTCLYRRDQANMPGSQREVKNAMEENIKFQWLSQPLAFQGDNHISHVVTAKMRLGTMDKTGRQQIEKIDDSHEELPADLVIKALGFEPEDLPDMFQTPELIRTSWGTIKVDPKDYMTNINGVFAAGDIVRGASLVVWAIKEGKEAAKSIHRWIHHQSLNV